MAVNLVERLAERKSSGYEVFGGLSVSSLVMFPVKMDRMPRQREDGFFLACGDCLASDVGDVFFGVAANKDSVGVAEIAGFGYEFVNVWISH